MPSKQVTDRQKTANAVVAAIDTHAAAATTAITALLSPHLRSGEEMPNVALLLALVGRGCNGTIQSLVTADNVHQGELADDDPARHNRDDAATALRQESINLREILTGMYGGAITTQVVSEAVPRDPVMLSRHGQTIEENLARITLPAPRIPGATLDKAAIITRFGALRQTLDDTIQVVAREVREAQATQSAKDAAMDSFDHFFSMGADVTSSLLRLGGMPEQAAKLRPSTRRPGHTVADEETPEPATAPPANG
jgi:hypothetical protein